LDADELVLISTIPIMRQSLSARSRWGPSWTPIHTKDAELIGYATQIKLRAERRAGEMLAEMEKAKGARGTGSNQHRQVRSPATTAPPPHPQGDGHHQDPIQPLAELGRHACNTTCPDRS
jgi:hypothetical protein